MIALKNYWPEIRKLISGLCIYRKNEDKNAVPLKKRFPLRNQANPVFNELLAYG